MLRGARKIADDARMLDLVFVIMKRAIRSRKPKSQGKP
jgi:hypothetical protein